MNNTTRNQTLHYYIANDRQGMPTCYCVACDITDSLGLGRRSAPYVYRYVSEKNWKKESVQIQGNVRCPAILLTDEGVDELLDGIGTPEARALKARMQVERDPIFRMFKILEMMEELGVLA